MTKKTQKRKLIILATLFQITLISLIGLSHLGFEIPIIRQIVGFICLFIIPGILMIGALKIKDLNILDYIVIIIGLGISSIMFIGFFVNFLLPFLGIEKPITVWPLITVHSCFIGGLLILVVYKNKDCKLINMSLNFKEIFLPINLLFLFLPILAIAGAMVVTYYQINTLLLILIILIVCIPIILIFSRSNDIKGRYQIAIMAISLALMLHVIMVSHYPNRLNVDNEFYYQNLVVENGFWEVSLSHPTNTVMSIVIMAPVLFNVLGVDTMCIFKLIYPLIFSFVPLVLFRIFSIQLNSRAAFLSVLFFMFTFYFFMEAPLLKRQQIAILFFSLLILSMFTNKINLFQKTSLAIIFSISLVVSHYAISYICLFIFVLSYILYILSKKLIESKVWMFLKSKFNFIENNKNYYDYMPTITIFSLTFLILYLIITLSWYMYTGSGAAFNNPVNLVNHIFMSIGDFLDPSKKSSVIETALGGGFLTAPILRKIWLFFQYLTELFIVVGFINVVIKQKVLSREYIFLSSSCFIFLLFCIIAPFMSFAMNMPRIFFVLLIILAPYCIVGGEVTWKKFIGLINNICNIAVKRKNHIKGFEFEKVFLVAVLIPYFLFNVGFIFEVGGYTEKTRELVRIPSSESLSYGKVDTGYYSKQEVTGALRVSQFLRDDRKIFADKWYGNDLVSAWRQNVLQYPEDLKIPDQAYAFLRGWNIHHDEIRVYTKERKSKYVKLTTQLGKRNRLYENGEALILGSAI